jgi:hypothetical protein
LPGKAKSKERRERKGREQFRKRESRADNEMKGGKGKRRLIKEEMRRREKVKFSTSINS